MRTRRWVAALGLLLIAGCSGGGGTAESTKPTFGGGTGTSVDAGTLEQAKEAAGIEDCPVAEGTPPAKDPLPDVTLDCLGGGNRVRLSGLTGKPTLINLWASWCGPCRDELPLLARAAKAYGDDLRILGIDFADAAPDAALYLAQRSGVTYPLLVDRDSETKVPLKVIGLPQTVFVDAHGTMVATERSPFRSYADLEAAIGRHLGVSS